MLLVAPKPFVIGILIDIETETSAVLWWVVAGADGAIASVEIAVIIGFVVYFIPATSGFVVEAAARSFMSGSSSGIVTSWLVGLAISIRTFSAKGNIFDG